MLPGFADASALPILLFGHFQAKLKQIKCDFFFGGNP